MKITRENYELFLIDYLDGNLEEIDKKELLVFLSQYPDLSEEFDLLTQSAPIVLNQNMASDKMDFSHLKKEEVSFISDEEMIASLEGDLSEAEEKLFKRKLVLYPQNKVSYELFLKTKLQPENLIFERKESLKKKAGISFALYSNYLAIAATLLLVGFLGILYNGNFNESKETLASKETRSKRSEPNAVEASGLNDASLEASNATHAAKLTTQVPIKRDLAFDSKSKVEKENIGARTVKNTRDLNGQKSQAVLENIVPLQSKNLPQELENKLALAGANSMLSMPTMGEFKLEQRAIANENEIGSDRMEIEQAPYLKPTDWLKVKMKTSMPIAITTLDTLRQGGARVAGNYAMQLVEKTTGITYQEKHDANLERSGFAIISKYFAYERNYKTEKY